MEKTVNKIMEWLPVVAIAFCMMFFVVAFWITRPNRGYLVPAVSVTVASESMADSVTNNVMYSSEYQQKLKTILEDRESIVKAEHEQFRAELGTWLSVFGLLAILATIMVSAFSYACQQASLKNEKEDVERQFDKLDERFEKLKADLEAVVREKLGQIDNAGDAAVSEVRGERSSMSEVVPKDATWQNDLVPVQNKSKDFIRMWSRRRSDFNGGRFDEKIELGISVLKDFDAIIEKYLADVEAESEILNKLNLFNIYLGQRAVRESDFYDEFLGRMKRVRPLSVPCDKVMEAVERSENGALRAGYYAKLYKLQEVV